MYKKIDHFVIWLQSIHFIERDYPMYQHPQNLPSFVCRADFSVCINYPHLSHLLVLSSHALFCLHLKNMFAFAIPVISYFEIVSMI